MAVPPAAVLRFELHGTAEARTDAAGHPLLKRNLALDAALFGLGGQGTEHRGRAAGKKDLAVSGRHSVTRP